MLELTGSVIEKSMRRARVSEGPDEPSGAGARAPETTASIRQAAAGTPGTSVRSCGRPSKARITSYAAAA
jgi:hypothetical protein